jgi:transglycosylase-like protein with SLT domain
MSDEADKPIKAPGVAALVRRNPQRVRQGAVGAIAAGLLLFLFATLTLPAGADAAHKQPITGRQSGLPQLFPTDPPIAAPQSVLDSKPEHARKKAPATKAVVSGLAANGIPNVALNAYRVAAARMANVQPGCGIDWALLAGIGREESDHGRFAGATLNADGRSSPPVIGIALNGHGTALIADTDLGRLDGDTSYDRAVGPMQFIPSTWAAYGSDANGDGKADVFNINDAALGSARYLCAAGGNLRTHAGQVAAVLAYNHSDEYLAQVLALAEAYRTGIPVHGLPVGNVTGGLPPVRAGHTPPVNPGPPTAVGSAAAKAAAQRAAAERRKRAASSRANSPQPSSSDTTSSSSTGTSHQPSPTRPPSTHSTSKPKPTPTPTKTCVLRNPLDPTQCLLWG